MSTVYLDELGIETYTKLDNDGYPVFGFKFRVPEGYTDEETLNLAAFIKQELSWKLTQKYGTPENFVKHIIEAANK